MSVNLDLKQRAFGCVPRVPARMRRRTMRGRKPAVVAAGIERALSGGSGGRTRVWCERDPGVVGSKH